MDKKQMEYDQKNNISWLFISFFISAGVVMFAGLMAFDLLMVLKGVIICYVYAPFVYFLPGKIKFNSQLRLFRIRIHLNSFLCIIGIIISFYQLFKFTPPVRYLGNF